MTKLLIGNGAEVSVGDEIYWIPFQSSQVCGGKVVRIGTKTFEYENEAVDVIAPVSTANLMFFVTPPEALRSAIDNQFEMWQDLEDRGLTLQANEADRYLSDLEKAHEEMTGDEHTAVGEILWD